MAHRVRDGVLPPLHAHPPRPPPERRLDEQAVPSLSFSLVHSPPRLLSLSARSSSPFPSLSPPLPLLRACSSHPLLFVPATLSRAKQNHTPTSPRLSSVLHDRIRRTLSPDTVLAHLPALTLNVCVSRRFTDKDQALDLDLTYICDRLIGMALPCVCDVLYRNDIQQVSRFFASRHYGPTPLPGSALSFPES